MEIRRRWKIILITQRSLSWRDKFQEHTTTRVIHSEDYGRTVFQNS